jgi:hypothetical protein
MHSSLFPHGHGTCAEPFTPQTLQWCLLHATGANKFILSNHPSNHYGLHHSKHNTDTCSDMPNNTLLLGPCRIVLVPQVPLAIF